MKRCWSICGQSAHLTLKVLLESVVESVKACDESVKPNIDSGRVKQQHDADDNNHVNQ